MILLGEVVAASAEVAATRSRKAKTATLATLLAGLQPDEVRPATAWLAGEMLQGRTGIGWRTLQAVSPTPASTSTLTVGDVDAALDRLAAMAGSGTGVGARRAAELGGLLDAATPDEGRFLVRLLGGELRQGALEGIMIEAVAAAAEVPAEAVRRAFMMSGRLPTTAHVALTGPDPVADLGAIGLEVMRPLRPMLASPGDSLEAALAELGAPDGDPGVVVEHKLDGARIQVHRRGDEVRVWSRTLREITDGVPEIVALTRDPARRDRGAGRRDPRRRRGRPAPAVPGVDEGPRLGRYAALVLRLPAPRRRRPGRRAAVDAAGGARGGRRATV